MWLPLRTDCFQWQGLAHVSHKEKWPDWTPRPETIAHQPNLPRFVTGVTGGPDNPLGARVTPPIASKEPTSRRPLDKSSGPVVSASSIPTSMSGCRSCTGYRRAGAGASAAPLAC